jgi:Uma2 family endonuclease
MATLAPTQSRITADEFWQLCADGKPRELVRGQVVETMPAGFEHRRVAQWVATQLTLYQQQIRQYLGEVVVETGFVIRYPDSESVRAPDVAFIRKERLPDPRPRTPSPSSRPTLLSRWSRRMTPTAQMREKVEEWLRAGVSVVWVIDPLRRTVEVFRLDAPVETLREGSTLTCESLLPGSHCH